MAGGSIGPGISNVHIVGDSWRRWRQNDGRLTRGQTSWWSVPSFSSLALIHDRDPLLTAEFLRTLEAAGVKSVKLPPRSPNLNPHAERFVRSIKESCLDRMIFFGEASLRTAVQNFVEHYHSERNHQGLANQLISPEPGHLGNASEVQRRGRLGGMLNDYYRAAA